MICLIGFITADTPNAVLHDLKLVHTDLKPENILLVNNGHKFIQVPVPGKVSTFTTGPTTSADDNYRTYSATHRQESKEYWIRQTSVLSISVLLHSRRSTIPVLFRLVITEPRRLF